MFQLSADDATLIAPTATADGRLQLLRLVDERVTCTLRQDTGRPTGYSRSLLSHVDPIACTRAVDSESGAGGLAVNGITNGVASATVSFHAKRPLCFLRDGSLLTCGAQGVFHWPRTLVAEPRELQFGPPVQIGAVKNAQMAASSSDGSVLAFTYATGELTLAVKQQPPRQIDTGLVYAEHVAVSPDGQWIAVASGGIASREDQVKVFASADGQLATTLPALGRSFVHFSANGEHLVCQPGDRGGTTQVWHVGTWQRIAEHAVAALAFDATGQYFATSDTHGTVALHERPTGNELLHLSLPGEETLVVQSFSHDGATLLVNSVRYNRDRLIDLRKIRNHLAQLRLDWDQPPFPPADHQPTRIRWLPSPEHANTP